MPKVTSRDGTTIAFDRLGQGMPVILVGGALEQRALASETAQLAPRLAQDFTVFHYDRRGRGDSTDTLPYAVEREIEDIKALIDEAGAPAFLFGISSGAALAMQATIQLGNKVKKLALYEAPYNDAPEARQAWKEYKKQLAELLAAGRNGDALGLFMVLVGMPADHLDAARVTVPALVMDGSASFPFMYATALALAKAMPQGLHSTLKGQTHEVDVQVLTPVLVEFFRKK